MGKWPVPLAFVAGIAVTSAAFPIIRWIDEANSCGYDVVREYPSPNKRAMAVVILSGCMLTPFVSSVAIKLDGEDFRFDKRDNYLFDVRNKNDIEVLWDSDDALTIVHARPDLIYRKVVVWRTMPISYREKP
jgi:hypothetical protein